MASNLSIALYPEKRNDFSSYDQWLQFLTVALWFSIAFNLVFVVPMLFPLCFYLIPYSRIPIMCYFGWIVYDCNEGPTKGRESPWWIENFRFHSIWKYFQDYFNGQLVKTCDLDSKERYILGIHPHGLYAVSMFANMWQNRDFSRAFPGLKLIGSTLPSNFWIPVWREYILAVGCASSSKESIRHRLTHGPPGTALAVLRAHIACCWRS